MARRGSGKPQGRGGGAGLPGKVLLLVLGALGAYQLGRQSRNTPPEPPPTPAPVVRSRADAPPERRRPTRPPAKKPEPAPRVAAPPDAPLPRSAAEEKALRIAAEYRRQELSFGRGETLSRLDEEGEGARLETPEVQIHPTNPASPPPDLTPFPTPDFPAAAPPPAARLPQEISRAHTGRPEVALTFDAGAGWKPARQILEALATAGVHCTFFVTGEWVSRNNRLTRRIVDEGHELGNHSWDHPPFTQLSDAEILQQLRRTEEVVRTTAGRSTLPFFRPPLGARDRRVLRAVGQAGFSSIYWTVDSHDSVVRGIRKEQIRDRVLNQVRAGSIVLLHCGSQATAEALPEILEGLQERGLAPVTVSRLLAK